MMDTAKLIVLPPIKRHLADLAIMNGIALALTALTYLIGYPFSETFVFVLFILAGITLIAGGISGFFVSSASFYALDKILFKKRKSDAEDEKKVNAFEIKQSKQGGRIIALGGVILIESILLAFAII